MRRIQRVNGHGMLRDDDDGVAQWDIAYRSDGAVESIEHRDRHGQVKHKENFSRNLRFVDFVRDDDVAAPRDAFAGEMGFDDDQRSDLHKRKAAIVRHLLDFDERGFVSSARYASDQFNTPAQDALGNYGEGYEPNSQGLATQIWYLDANGAACIQRNGVASRKDDYDAQGRRLQLGYLGQDGSAVLGNEGFASRLSTFDETGNEVETTNFGIGGEPVLHKNGYARTTRSYDARGNPVEWAYFGVDAQPVLHKRLCAPDARLRRARQCHRMGLFRHRWRAGPG